MISIVHISDMHARPSRERELKVRLSALINDLQQCKVSPDLIIVSGDIAYAGKPDEYNLALPILQSLLRETRLKPEAIVVCPGNHDIDRGAVDAMTEQGLKRSLLDTEAAESAFDHEKYSLPQQQAYLAFLNRLRNLDLRSPSYNTVSDIQRTQIGIASFNSAWRCSDDEAKEQLFLTLPQVHELSEGLEACPLKIAVVHHPFNWFHPSEQDIVHTDLLRRFDLVLTGHLHHAVTTATQRPGADSLVYSVPSFFDGVIDGQPDGYNIYHIDTVNQSVRCQHRKFIRSQERYDRNVEHAPDGESAYSLPHSALTRTVSTQLVQRMNDAASALEKSIYNSLQLAQKLEKPIFVRPVVEEVHWRKSGQVSKRIDDAYTAAMQAPCIVYGPADCGTSLFLQDVCSRINAGNQNAYALYFDHADIAEVKRPDQLLRIVRNRAESELEKLDDVDLTVAVDHVSYTDGVFVQTFLNLAAQENWHIIICVKSDLLFDALGPQLSAAGVSFLRMRYWGPSRLREFAKQYLGSMEQAVNVEGAIQFLRNCLANSDIPVTPLLVAMYLRTFCELGAELSGLSFIRLLEKMEEAHLDQADANTPYSIYNLRVILRQLAVACFEAGDISVPTETLCEAIQSFFGERYLDVDAERLITRLTDSGFVIESGNNIGFSCFVFFTFYLAQALEKEDIDLQSHLETLDRALRLGDALSFYAGRQRDDESIARRFLENVEREYPLSDRMTVVDLKNHIKHLLQPRQETEERDTIATEAVTARSDEKNDDERFHRDQAESRAVSRDLLTYSPPVDRLEIVIRHVLSLRALYNVFRNAEHISGERKVELLDRVIEHHMRCNMSLIDLYAGVLDDEEFHSLSAYCVTLSGGVFLSQNLGSSALKKTIEVLLEKTDDSFKRFLLISLYSDLRLANYAGLFESLIAEVEEPCMVEMCYAKVHELLVLYEGEKLPTSLIAAFNAAFDRRQRLFDKVSPINLQRHRDEALQAAKRQHYRIKRLKEMD